MKVGYQILADLQQQQAFKQWGYYVESQNPTDYRYWSIPFTSHYITMATKTYYEPKEEAVPWLVGIDMQKFICGYGANFIGSSYVSCVGIGCQPQWGFTNNTGRPYITFPFKFSNVFTAISCICHNGSPSEANTVYNVSISGMNIGASGGGSGKYWCAFGVAQQQWGFEETETKTIAFPISFESIKYVFLSKIYGPASGGADTVAYNFFRKSLTGVSFDYAYTRNWLAIGGKQPQWGTNRTNGIYSFPIPFTEALCCFGGGEAGSGYYDNASAYSNTQVRVYSDGSSRFVSWIAIGA